MNLRKIFIITVLISILTINFIPAFGSTNPTREELEAMIEEVALRRGIPSLILKAIARTESVFKHYNDDGSVKIGVSGSIGLMQIHNSRGTFDGSRLKTDIYYNIEAGAEILLEKWEMSASGKIPNVGDMDPNVLETWYMPLWAYNSYVESNNPNMIPYYFSTWIKPYAYQDLVLYKVIPEEYNQQVSMIDTSYLPETGLPDKNVDIPYPEETHKGDVALFEEGDKVVVKTRSSLNIRKEPNGKIIGKAEDGDEFYIIGDPELSGGYFWQKLADKDGKFLGWVARNWIILIEKNQEADKENKGEEDQNTEEIKLKEVKFKDIENHWAKEYIEDLYQKDIVKGKSETAFKPDDEITKEEFYVMLDRILEFENPEKESNIKDLDQVSDWAFKATYMLYKNNIIDTEEGYIFPKTCIKRKEVVKSLGRVLKFDDEYESITFEDIDGLNEEELEGLLKVYSTGLIKGKDEITFAPEDLITRGELSKLLSMIYDIELLYEIKQ